MQIVAESPLFEPGKSNISNISFFPAISVKSPSKMSQVLLGWMDPVYLHCVYKCQKAKKPPSERCSFLHLFFLTVMAVLHSGL